MNSKPLIKREHIIVNVALLSRGFVFVFSECFSINPVSLLNNYNWWNHANVSQSRQVHASFEEFFLVSVSSDFSICWILGNGWNRPGTA
jgi:hypothetical protein